MKKIFLSGFLVIAAAAYGAWMYLNGQQPAAVATNATPATQTSDQTNANEVASAPPQPAQTQTTPTHTQTGAYKDGTYTGSAADAFYGTLQVAATISGGKLTDVTYLQYPNDQPESRQVNGRSNPLLKSEAIAAQSANVDIVSGATQSSEAFIESLGSALAQAKNS